MSLCLTALSLCLGLAFGAPRADPELDGHWQLWKSWHNKDYHEVSARRCALSAASPPGALRRALPAESRLLGLSAARGRRWGGMTPPYPVPLLCRCVHTAGLCSVFWLRRGRRKDLLLHGVRASRWSSLRLPECAGRNEAHYRASELVFEQPP